MLGVYGARDIDKLKAYLTRRSDKGVRLAYDKRPKTHMRQWFAVGTTNNIDIIPPDPSGVRRFATVRVSAPKQPFTWLVQNRDQIFAHAKHLIFSENYKEWEFDKDAEAVRRKFAEKHQQHYELWESKILDHFDEIEGLSMNEICDLFADNSSMNPKGLRAEEVRRSLGKDQDRTSISLRTAYQKKSGRCIDTRLAEEDVKLIGIYAIPDNGIVAAFKDKAETKLYDALGLRWLISEKRKNGQDISLESETLEKLQTIQARYSSFTHADSDQDESD